MLKKYKIVTEVEIDIQQVFADNLEDYVPDDNAQDSDYVIGNISAMFKDIYTKQMMIKMEWMIREVYPDIKHHNEADILIARQMENNVVITEIK